MRSIVELARRLIDSFNRSVPGRILLRYNVDQGWFLGAAIAYNALFSIFPIILLMAAILGTALSDPQSLSSAISVITDVLPPQLGAPVTSLIQTTTQQSGLFGIVSLLGLAYVSVGLFAAFETAMDRIYRVPLRSYLPQRLMGLAMIVLFTVMIVLQIGAFSATQLLFEVASEIPIIGPQLSPLLPLAGLAVSATSAFILCLAFFYVVPNLRLTFREVLPGTLFATVALMLLVQLFPLYARLAGGGSQYGQAFGFALLMMTWSYFVAQAFIIGAELNVALHHPRLAVPTDPLAIADPAHEPEPG